MMELERHWDPEHRFEGAILRPYQHWVVELSFVQHTLGCFIIFCRKQGVRLISECTTRQLEELPFVMGDVERAIRKRFGAEHFNYLQMGNALPLLHLHGIPRYDGPREYAGRTWQDPQRGLPPAYSFTNESREFIVALCQELRTLLPVWGE